MVNGLEAPFAIVYLVPLCCYSWPLSQFYFVQIMHICVREIEREMQICIEESMPVISTKKEDYIWLNFNEEKKMKYEPFYESPPLLWDVM